MNDSGANPKERFRAARIAAKYTHAPRQPDKLAPVDEYGFSFSRTLAKTIAGDWVALEYFESGRMGAKSADKIQAASGIYARQAERDQVLQCPSDYSPAKDFDRRSELFPKIKNGTATMAEQTEFAYAVARITAFQAAHNRTPEGHAGLRAKELRARRWMRAAGRAKPLESPPEEQEELERIYKEFPSAMPTIERVHQLQQRCSNGTITAAEQDELDELLRRRPALAKVLQMDAEFRSRHAGGAGSA